MESREGGRRSKSRQALKLSTYHKPIDGRGHKMAHGVCILWYFILSMKNPDIAGNSATYYVHFAGPHVRHFSDGNQTVCPTLKK
jgi:hypothetical protein